MDIMKRINSGELKPAPAKDVEDIKQAITENCEELIDIGARIRPLLVDGNQVGWARGIHYQERQMLKRWIREPNDYVVQTLLHATSFTKDDIEAMQSDEITSLIDVVKQMSDHDLSLYPYLNAYVTTQSSEVLWYGKGEQLTSYTNRVISMPDGGKITIMAPPDHARMWATLCSYREQAKRRLDDNMNSLFIVRPWAGKHADPIAKELTSVAKQLETGSNYMWEQIVKVQKKVDVNDGWGHPGDSLEDLQRELKGMMEGDKHERLMEAWSKQMVAEAEEKAKLIEEARRKRGIAEAGVYQGSIEILTEKEIKARQEALAKGHKPTPQTKVKSRSTFEQDATARQIDKVRKYR
jgi:hypothetical protein